MIQAGDPDILTYTAVCSDSIPTLEPFKSNCMPVFLFVAAGNIVAFVHGSDGKKMKEVMHKMKKKTNIKYTQVLKYQVENEMTIQKNEGVIKRKSISLEDTLPVKVNIEDENEQ